MWKTRVSFILYTLDMVQSLLCQGFHEKWNEWERCNICPLKRTWGGNSSCHSSRLDLVRGQPNHLLKPNRSFSSQSPYVLAHWFTLWKLLCHDKGHIQDSSCCMAKTCGHHRRFPPAHSLAGLTTAPRVIPRPRCRERVNSLTLGKGRSRDRTWMQPGDGLNSRRAEFGSWPHRQLYFADRHGEDRVCGMVLWATGIEGSWVLIRQK